MSRPSLGGHSNGSYLVHGKLQFWCNSGGCCNGTYNVNDHCRKKSCSLHLNYSLFGTPWILQPKLSLDSRDQGWWGSLSRSRHQQPEPQHNQLPAAMDLLHRRLIAHNKSWCRTQTRLSCSSEVMQERSWVWRKICFKLRRSRC